MEAPPGIERLHGPDPLVLVDGAAGCGKTYEVVTAAMAMSQQLEPWERVLLLTHTNAARDVFRQRLQQRAAQVQFQTLDSFVCELVGSYARYLNITLPFRPGVKGHPTFPEVRELALRVLSEAPALVSAMAERYPVVFVDEHQDSSRVQHELVSLLGSQTDVRVRIFGDRLQTIFDFDDEDRPDWGELIAQHGAVTMTTPHRWKAQPALGDWLVAARTALLDGRPVSLRDCPQEVVVHRWNGPAPGPNQRGFAADCLTYLRRLGDCAILVRNREHAVGISARIGHIHYYEGADAQAAGQYLERAEAAAGDPQALVDVALEVLGTCGTGLPQSQQDKIRAACRPAGIEFGRKVKLRPLLKLFVRLYDDPSVHEWLGVLRDCFRLRKELGWAPFRYDPILILTDKRLREAESPIDALPSLVRRRSETPWVPSRFVSTIHKVKGREFEEVAIPYCARTSFPDTAEGRSLLYVAMTRACTRLHLLIPDDDPTPLLET